MYVCAYTCTRMFICTKAIINRGQHTHSLKPVQITTPTPDGLFTMLYCYMQCVERWFVILFVYHSPSMCASTLIDVRMCVHI